MRVMPEGEISKVMEEAIHFPNSVALNLCGSGTWRPEGEEEEAAVEKEGEVCDPGDPESSGMSPSAWRATSSAMAASRTAVWVQWLTVSRSWGKDQEEMEARGGWQSESSATSNTVPSSNTLLVLAPGL